MFAATYSAQRSMPALAQAYSKVGVETGISGASPHKLIELLFDGFQDAISQARGALRNRMIEAKGKAISRALRIIDEGLQGGLNLSAGGQLAADLSALYTYVSLRLTHANVHNDDAALAECANLIEPIRSAWVAIGPQVHGTRG